MRPDAIRHLALAGCGRLGLQRTAALGITHNVAAAILTNHRPRLCADAARMGAVEYAGNRRAYQYKDVRQDKLLSFVCWIE